MNSSKEQTTRYACYTVELNKHPFYIKRLKLKAKFLPIIPQSFIVFFLSSFFIFFLLYFLSRHLDQFVLVSVIFYCWNTATNRIDSLVTLLLARAYNSNLIGHWKSHVITLINVSKYYYLIHKESCLANPLTIGKWKKTRMTMGVQSAQASIRPKYIVLI